MDIWRKFDTSANFPKNWFNWNLSNEKIGIKNEWILKFTNLELLTEMKGLMCILNISNYTQSLKVLKTKSCFWLICNHPILQKILIFLRKHVHHFPLILMYCLMTFFKLYAL